MLSSQAKQKMQSTGAELNEKYFYQKDIFLTAHIICSQTSRPAETFPIIFNWLYRYVPPWA